MKKLYFILAFGILGIISSCQKDPVEKKGEVSFSFSVVGNILKSTNTCGDPFNVVVTVKDKNGIAVISKKSMQLFDMNGSFITSPVLLVVGDYELTEFFITDVSNKIIYASPKANSSLAYLVRNPLSTKFSVTQDVVTKLSPEVVCATQAKPEDFGYVSFSFQVVKTFDFLIGVFIYNDSIKNFEMTNADLTVKADGKNLFTKSLTNITSQITLPDSYTNFEISVSKAGYRTFTQTYTAADLKTHFASSQAGPLIIKLEKGCSFNGLVAYYPFDGDIKDYSGSNYHGSTTKTIHFASAIKGQGLQMFDTSITKYFQNITIPNTVNPSEYSVSFWFTAYKNTNHNSIMMLNDGTGWPDSKLWIYTSTTKLTALQNKQDLRTKTYGITFDFNSQYVNSPDVQLNVFYHVVYTFKNNTLCIYMDGKLVQTLTNVGNIPASTSNIIIGTSPNPNAIVIPLSYQMCGILDELRIYNRALTQAEILAGIDCDKK